jgi:hypothetical protein
MMDVISFGFGHSNTAVGFGSTVAGAFGVNVNGVRAAATGLPVCFTVDTFRLDAAVAELRVPTGFDATAGFAVTTTFATGVVFTVAAIVVFATGVVFAETTVFEEATVFAPVADFATVTVFVEDLTTGTVFPFTTDFDVTDATTFVLPFPLVLAVALFTGARRETVLEPAREALAEVTFGIDGHSNETAHKTRTATR